MPKEEANDILNIVAWDSTEGSKLPRAKKDFYLRFLYNPRFSSIGTELKTGLVRQPIFCGFPDNAG